jgi:hypothetical protein
MKTILHTLIALIAFAAPCFAQSGDIELKVQRHTLDRQDKIAKPRQNAQELTRGLRITVKNTSLKTSEEAELEWSILVQRPGQQRALLSSGKAKIKTLKASETTTLDVGAVPVQDVGNQRQDMEYQVIVRRSGTEAAKVESIPSFSQQADSARSIEKKPRKQK